jgi:hypothetical protein
MSNPTPACVVCAQTSEQIPLIQLQYRQNFYYICPSHFPILIHQPGKLAGLLPGAEQLQPHDHGDE